MLTLQLSLRCFCLYSARCNLLSENFTSVRTHAAVMLNYSITRHTEYVQQIYIYEKSAIQLTSVGLAHARPNKHWIRDPGPGTRDPGPEDQGPKDPRTQGLGTQGPGDPGTRGPEDPRTRGHEEPRIWGPEDVTVALTFYDRNATCANVLTTHVQLYHCNS